MIRPIGKNWTLGQWEEYERRRIKEAHVNFIILSALPVIALLYLVLISLAS